MNTHFTYLIILSASLIGPLALSFDKKVAFYKKWKCVFLAMLIPALFYIVWDIYFTSEKVWSFNEKYIIGIKFCNLPLEEILFFFIVPYCCVFIYECIKNYFPKIPDKFFSGQLLKLLAFILFISGIIFYKKSYTTCTFVFLSCCISIIYLFKNFFKAFNASLFLISYSIILIPFLIINGLLTSIPVVLYTNAENLQLRIFTIPFEDIFYGMLLILMNILIYEKLKTIFNRNPLK